jgi:hypothetical protein
MIIPAEKLAGQNSAYAIKTMKGAFGNEGALPLIASQHRDDAANGRSKSARAKIIAAAI